MSCSVELLLMYFASVRYFPMRPIVFLQPADTKDSTCLKSMLLFYLHKKQLKNETNEKRGVHSLNMLSVNIQL